VEAAAKPASEADPTALAQAALWPYRTAHAYKGTRTTTVIVGKERSNITTTTTLQARCDSDGAITRLRAQSMSWGYRDDPNVTHQEDFTLLYDGTTLWTYWPDADRYRRSSQKPSSLAALLGLPPAAATWTFAPRHRDDLPTERALHARIGEEDWTLYLNAATGHLLRIVQVHGTGAQRTETTTAIRDLAFDRAADLPDFRFVFAPPAGAREDTTVIAQDSIPALP
jgi:outer membrane lipoprotein-sorting protein